MESASVAIATPSATPLRERARTALYSARFAVVVYLGTRALIMLVALVNGTLRHHAFTHELAQWDGLWYRAVANHGYPDHVIHAQSSLGFFPLYPMVIWLVGRAFVMPIAHYEILSTTIAGVIVSGVGGLVATVLVGRLAETWWGERAARRAVLIFCLFPGSVVFSMVYAEGIMIPLAAGCILALQQRRWVLAGALAGIATACEPQALVLVVVCAVSAGLELHRNRSALRPLLAPVLSLAGAASFAAFLWLSTGNPLASLIAQRDGWNEKSDAFALVHLTERLADQMSLRHFNHPTINLNLVVGLAGALILIAMLVLIARNRHEMSLEAIVYTLGIAWLGLTSEYVPPTHIPVFAQFRRWEGKRVLEVGCGIGTDSINFARAGAQLTAVDLSTESLRIAKQRAEVIGVADRIDFVNADAEELTSTIAGPPYDLIYSFGVIHHTPRPERALAEMRALAAPGGTLKVMVYHRRSWKVLWIVLSKGHGDFRRSDELIATYSEAQTGCPVTYAYSRGGARELVERNGFSVEEVSVDHVFPYRVGEYVQYRYVKEPYFRWMPDPLFRAFERQFGWHLLVTARAG